MNAQQEVQGTVAPLGRGQRARPLRSFRVRPASTLKDEHEQVLALVGENFCRLFGADITTSMGAEVSVAGTPVQQWSWDDLLSALPEPYCAARLTMPPLPGAGLIALDVQLATAIVEKLLGGAGHPQERTAPLTEVELSLLGELHQRAVGDFAEALSLVIELRPVAHRQESRLELIRASAARSLLIAFDFEVTLTSAYGKLRIAVPAEGLVASLEAFSGASASAPSSIANTGRLGDCPVETSVRFNDTTVTSRRVVELARGDVVLLDHPVDRPLTLYVGKVPFLSVLAGRRGNHKAFAVIGPSEKKGTAEL
ncbi:MAG TPA: flagellar motor switch protein FliM [Acidimicrobiales bacterium]|nr:flagellar motor switch protein FliM [Acidimicrobiales bacterium]